MSFLPMANERERIVPGSGPKTARIAIVGEAPGSYEMASGKPFVGPAGTILEQCMHTAGIIRSELYITNVVKVKPPGNDISPYFSSTKGTFTAAGQEWVEALLRELDEVDANLIVACGSTATAALCGIKAILKYRGYLFPSRGLKRVRKVLPMIHPSAALRGMYIYRHLIAADMRKAKQFSDTATFDRPQRQLVYDFSNVGEAIEWLEYFSEQPIVCFDIEVLNYEISCIGMSSDPMIACSFPLADMSEQDELLMWRGVQKVLGNPASIKVAQNAIFDIHFLLTRCGIQVRGPVRDTMLAHSIMYPELPKGLGFLGSIYCGSQAYWKDSVRFTNIKEES